VPRRTAPGAAGAQLIARKENSEQGKATKTVMEPASQKGRADTTFHARNFLDGVKGRKETNCPVEVGHHSTTATLLARRVLPRPATTWM
jgi:hypothetical protein